MAHRHTRRSRWAWRALVTAIESTLIAFTFAACSGGSKAPTGPNDPPGENPGPLPAPQPAPGPEPAPTPEPPTIPQDPPEHGGIQGTYVLTQINNAKPGQLVTIANPDGVVVGLYRFDAATTLTLDALQTFTLQLRYSDDKDQYGYDDHGEWKSPGQAGNSLALAFSSGDFGDQFNGIAVDGTVAFMYDFDGDGRPDTTFGFQLVN
jgi:hypothetical protein